MRVQKKPETNKERKVTYFKTKPTPCPVCEKTFLREELFQGRVNAGNLTEELHRLYTPMAAYGEVIPLIYPVSVCPNCYFAALPADFESLSDKVKPALYEGISARIDSVSNVFPTGLDFSSPRNLKEGAASYFLMMQCYQAFPDKDSPVIKQAISAIRAAWLFKDMDARMPKQNYDGISLLFYQKARFLFQRSIELDTKGKQSLQNVKFLGPDTDTNFGYDGVLYLSALLELNYGQRENPELRLKQLDYLACAVAKMFGLGRKAKNKPGPLLERARDLYDKLKVETNKDYDGDEV